MKLLGFNDVFPDEKTCRAHWKQQRESEGIICKHCGKKEHTWKEKYKYWECNDCHFRTSLRSGTIMESSKLPFREWYIGMHYLTATKHAFSAKELQKELSRKRYEPVWTMLHKIRNAMGMRDGEYVLENFVEFDDAFFTTIKNQTKEERKAESAKEAEPLKRGKGSQKKSKVLVMTESLNATQEEREAGNYSKSRKLGYIKMVVVEDLKKDTIDQVVEKYIDANSTVRTDGSNSYVDLKTKVKKHQFQILKTSADVNRYLPWVHTTIANAKREFDGIHYLIGKGYLQQYLNEFCYNVNRRYFGENIFDRLVISCVNCQHYPIKKIRYDYLRDCG